MNESEQRFFKNDDKDVGLCENIKKNVITLFENIRQDKLLDKLLMGIIASNMIYSSHIMMILEGHSMKIHVISTLKVLIQV